MKLQRFISFLLPICFIVGCQSENAKELKTSETKNGPQATRKQNLNVSILLDLSDRIDTKKNANPSMQYYQRDLGYIGSISKGFEQYLRNKTLRLLNDQIQVYFEPEPLNPQINKLAGQLKFSITKDNGKAEEITKISKDYALASEQIYKLALHDGKYDGADIWGFFKNKVKDYCIKSDHRNILFILTDGYMFHKDSKFMSEGRSSYLVPELIRSFKLNTPGYGKIILQKNYGFIPATTELNNLEVFVLGINPERGNPFEGDVIDSYWRKWFEEMSIKKYVLKRADLPANLDLIIKKYINQ